MRLGMWQWNRWMMRGILIMAMYFSYSFMLVHAFAPPSSRSFPSNHLAPSNTNSLGSSSTCLWDKPNIEVISQPNEEFLNKQGVFRWGTWGCLPGKFPWTYGESESCYLLSGKVTVTPTDGRPAATFGKGDFVTFPAGMSCEWDVTEAVQKHFKFF